LLAAALLVLAIGGGIYLLSQGATTPASAATTPRAPKGFFGIAPQTGLTEKDVEYMKAGGIESVRWPLAWATVQAYKSSSKHGGYDWEGFDLVVEQVASQGLQVLPFFYGTPKFLTPKETTMPINTGIQRREWAAFVKAAVERYGPGGAFWTEHSPATIKAHEKEVKAGYAPETRKLIPIAKPVPIKTWQVWNEANFFYFAYPVSPHNYARLLKLTAPVIRKAEPGAKVVLTGLFGRPTAGAKRGMPAAQFLEGLYKVPGIKSDFDGVALHPYAVDSEELEEIVEELHAVTLANHDRVPLYITEMGWGSQNDFHIDAFEHGVNGQVEELKSAYAYLLENRNKLDLKQVYWFSWKDLPESCAFCDSVGFFKSGPKFRAKPSWRAFTEITRGQPRP
jgi:hypothetical protein